MATSEHDQDPAPTTATVTASDGELLAYRTAGRPVDRPLVLVHGWAQSSGAWGADLLTELAASFHVVAPDLRGHGGSGGAQGPFDDPLLWARDLQAVLADAGVAGDPGAVLLGWSYGGIVVSDYLAALQAGHLDGPRPAGIVLCGAVTGISRSPGAAIGPAMRAVVPAGWSDDPEEAAAALGSFVDEVCPGADVATRRQLLSTSLATPPQVRAGLLSRRVDNDETLRRLEIPAAVFHGADDTVIPPETGQANADQIPDAEFVSFAGCGHTIFRERPEEFLEALGAFARRL